MRLNLKTENLGKFHDVEVEIFVFSFGKLACPQLIYHLNISKNILNLFVLTLH